MPLCLMRYINKTILSPPPGIKAKLQEGVGSRPRAGAGLDRLGRSLCSLALQTGLPCLPPFGCCLAVVVAFRETVCALSMKCPTLLCLGALLVLAGCGPGASIPQGIQVHFAPGGAPTEAVVDVLAHATNTVLVQAYSFTSAPIAQALVEARRRGVKTRVILDGSQRTEKYSEADFLAHNEIPTLIDARHAIAHNKIMIIDGYVVITGSFNFTKAAEEKNAENLLIINDSALAERYTQNWQAHATHSEPYERDARPEERPVRRERIRY